MKKYHKKKKELRFALCKDNSYSRELDVNSISTLTLLKEMYDISRFCVITTFKTKKENLPTSMDSYGFGENWNKLHGIAKEISKDYDFIIPVDAYTLNVCKENLAKGQTIPK